MKKGFTFVELLIVVGVLGILAAVIVPFFKSYSDQAKETTAKDHLHILRAMIEFYSAKNNDVAPGYPENDIALAPTAAKFELQITGLEGSSDSIIGGIKTIPENPFNNKNAVKVITDAQAFPSEPVDTENFGWVYKPSTKTIRLNWSGTDSEGQSYFEY